jgi:DNA-binding transcriptional LysR family regulator
VQCESFLALPEIVATSDIIAIVPWQMLAQPETRDRLARVPVRENLKPTEISLFTRAGAPLTPIARDFVDLVRTLALEHGRR